MSIKAPELKIKDNGSYHSIPLDEIIYIKVELKECNFYLKKTAITCVPITLTEVWKQINQLDPKNIYHLNNVSRNVIINMSLLISSNPKTGVVTLLRGESPTLTPMPEKKPCKVPKMYKELADKAYELRKEKEKEHKSDAEKEKEDERECLNHDIYVKVGEKAAKALQKYLKNKEKEVLGAYVTKARLIVPKENLSGAVNMEAGHQYVDLGLPSGTKWAAENLGEYTGHTAFYGWGEVYERAIYDWAHYEAYPQGSRSKMLDDSKDVARKCWGGNWRMPTYQDFQELIEHCSFHWCSDPKGCLVKGPNGNRIFLHAYGYKEGDKRNEVRGLMGKYWCSYGYRDDSAMAFNFKDDDSAPDCIKVSMSSMLRCCGLSIRPVLTETGGLAPAKKKVLLVESQVGIFDSPFPHLRWNPMGWKVLKRNFPLNPDTAVSDIKAYCEKHRPDVIVGICSGSFVVMQLEGYPRICLDPDQLPSVTLDFYREFAKRQHTVTAEMVEQFREAEKTAHVSQGKDKCCAVFSRPRQTHAFDSWRCIDVEPWDEPSFPQFRQMLNWGNTFLYPLIEEMLK